MKKGSLKPAYGEFMLIGFVPIKPDGPTLGTPIFRLREDDDGEYIQLSTKEKTIESLLKLPSPVSVTKSFVRVRPNTTLDSGSEFLVGFRDAHNVPQVYSKKDFITKFAKEFSDYHGLPFLQWNVISCFDAIDLVAKLTDKNIELIYASQFEALAHDYVSGTYEFFRRSSKIKASDVTLTWNKIQLASLKKVKFHSYNYDSLVSLQAKRFAFDKLLVLPEIADLKFFVPTNNKRSSQAAGILRSLRETMLRGLLESRRKIGRTSERRSAVHKVVKPKAKSSTVRRSR